MHDGITPQGQMELRLEAFQDTNLTDLKVESCSTVTARYVFDDGGFYEFRVSPGSAGTPDFSWNQVTIGEFNVHTRSREHRGPAQTLADLLALGENDGPFGNFWREDAMALIGIHEVAAEHIQECIEEAASAAADAASERLTKRFQQPAAAPSIVEVDEFFEAFQAACQQRAPYCDGIQMDWGHDLEQLPGVAFGLAPGGPDQILYQADPTRAKQLYLNGFWTAEYRLEEDLLEQFPDDAWARLGARNAARDLLAIQRAAHDLMAATRQDVLQQVDSVRLDRLFDSVQHGRPVDNDWHGYTAGQVQSGSLEMFERVKEYLSGLHPTRRSNVKRGPKPGAQAARDSLT